jgi:hypothetical protein
VCMFQSLLPFGCCCHRVTSFRFRRFTDSCPGSLVQHPLLTGILVLLSRVLYGVAVIIIIIIIIWRSLCSEYAMDWTTEEYWFDSRQGNGIFLFSKRQYSSWGPPTSCSVGAGGAFLAIG